MPPLAHRRAAWLLTRRHTLWRHGLVAALSPTHRRLKSNFLFFWFLVILFSK
jgi:hypothetical protein